MCPLSSITSLGISFTFFLLCATCGGLAKILRCAQNDIPSSIDSSLRLRMTLHYADSTTNT